MCKFTNSQIILEFTVQICILKKPKFTNALSNYFMKICSEFSIEFFEKLRGPFI